MLLCVDSVHITGWLGFLVKICCALRYLHCKLRQMDAAVNLAFFKPNGRMYGDVVNANTRLLL